jgi:hypothetical protein
MNYRSNMKRIQEKRLYFEDTNLFARQIDFRAIRARFSPPYSTSTQFCNMYGLSFNTWSCCENHTIGNGWSSLNKIAKKLELPVWVVLQAGQVGMLDDKDEETIRVTISAYIKRFINE